MTYEGDAPLDSGTKVGSGAIKTLLRGFGAAGSCSGNNKDQTNVLFVGLGSICCRTTAWERWRSWPRPARRRQRPDAGRSGLWRRVDGLLLDNACKLGSPPTPGKKDPRDPEACAESSAERRKMHWTVRALVLRATMPLTATAQSSTAVKGYCANKDSARRILADRATERRTTERNDAAFEMQRCSRTLSQAAHVRDFRSKAISERNHVAILGGA